MKKDLFDEKLKESLYWLLFYINKLETELAEKEMEKDNDNRN
jgi:hypothetical protein